MKKRVPFPIHSSICLRSLQCNYHKGRTSSFIVFNPCLQRTIKWSQKLRDWVTRTGNSDVSHIRLGIPLLVRNPLRDESKNSGGRVFVTNEKDLEGTSGTTTASELGSSTGTQSLPPQDSTSLALGRVWEREYYYKILFLVTGKKM